MRGALARNPLFDGLEADALEAIEGSMRRRQFEPREVLCRAGEAGDNLLLIVSGLARVMLPDPGSGDLRTVAKLRRGDLVGEMSLVTGQPRTATVVAALPTTALELGRDDFAAVLARHPSILANLNRILSGKLAETTARVGEAASRGEAVALLVGTEAAPFVPEILAATESASARPVTSIDARSGLEGALASLDGLLADHGTTILVSDADEDRLPLLVEAVDRAVAVVREEAELERFAASLGGESEQRLEAILLADSQEAGKTGLPVVRVVALEGSLLPPDELAWIGRHLARTKLGLALGAGGAKGYAHVGVLRVLEESGYTVDCVAGSSIGAIVGSWLALGMDSGAIEATMRQTFRPEIVEQIFKLSLTGASTGLETMTNVMRETTEDKSFADLEIPLAVMTVDLNGQQAAPIGDGALWQALLAATALAGIFPPYEQNGQRLVDGLALVPVPTDAARELGADVVVSVNIISRQTLPAWPGEMPPAEQPKGPRSRMLDTLLEVMDLGQLDSSERHAARADVPITPRFGPSSWRDFHLADLFLAAGRDAAEEQLPALQALAKPQPSRLPI
jgi:predicted acylesterase/phospholipase RssA/CRP-like cAMP-binding protein